MRTTRSALPLVLLLVAACGGDRPTGIAPPTSSPHAAASTQLAFTGSSPLNNSAAFALNDSAVIVGYAQLAQFTPNKAVTWRPPEYLVTVLPDLGPQDASAAYAIGADGTIGGKVCDGMDDNVPCHPAYWRGGALHQLGGFGRVNAVCPCDGHTLVGRIDVGANSHGAIWEDDILIDVGVPAGFANAQLVSVSHGFIVGNAYHGAIDSDPEAFPFRWSPTAGWTALEGDNHGVLDVNRDGTAVGVAPLLWLNGTNTPTAITEGGYPAAINDSGVVAGTFFLPIEGGTLPQPGEWTSMGGWAMIGIETTAGVRDINNANQAVGFEFESGRSYALLWTP